MVDAALGVELGDPTLPSGGGIDFEVDGDDPVLRHPKGLEA